MNNQNTGHVDYGANPVLQQAGVKFPSKHMRVHFADHVSQQIAAIDKIDLATLNDHDRTTVAAARKAWQSVKIVEDRDAERAGQGGQGGQGGQNDRRPAERRPADRPVAATPSPIPAEVTDLFAAFQLAHPTPANRIHKPVILASLSVAEQSALSDVCRAALARLRAAWDAPVRWGDLGLPVVTLRDLVERGIVRRPEIRDVCSVEDAVVALDAIVETRENSARVDWEVSRWAEGTPDPVYVLPVYDFARLVQMEAAWRSIVARVKMDYAKPKTGGGWAGARR
jgi:hypothetical protein